jgi:hypothetical protein
MNNESINEARLAAKKRLLDQCKKVIALSRHGDDEIKEMAWTSFLNTPICNTVVMRKYARGVKDPNPVAATMATMSLKYPISMKTDFLEEFTEQEREAVVLGGENPRRDSRQYNRTLCTLRAIDIWLSKKILPTDNQMAMINVLHKQDRDAVASYYSFNWPTSVIKFGVVPKTQSVIPTKIPMLDIPPDKRKAVVAEILMRGLNPYDTEGIAQYTARLEGEIGSLIVSGLDLGSQARLLYRSMDERYRCLPIASDIPKEAYQHSPAIAGPMWKATGLKAGESRIGEDSFKRECNLLVKKLLEGNRLLDTIRDIVAKMKYNGGPIEPLLDGIPEDYGIQYLKSLFGKAVTGRHRFEDHDICIEAGRVAPELQETPDGVKYLIYPNQERVYFETAHYKGYMDRKGKDVQRIQISQITSGDLIRLLRFIALYIRWRFNITRGSTLSQVKKNVLSRLESKPWDLLTFPSKSYQDMLKALDSPIICNRDSVTYFPRPLSTKVCVMREMASHAPVPQVLRPLPSGSMQGDGTRILAPEIITTLDTLGACWDSHHPDAFSWLPPMLGIYRLIDFLVSQNILEWVGSGNFYKYNEGVCSLLRPIDRAAVSNTAQILLTQAQRKAGAVPKSILAFWYAFAGENVIDHSIRYTFTYAGSYTVDLRMKSGTIIWDTTINRLKIGDKPLIRDRQHIDQEAMDNYFFPALDGVRLRTATKRHAEMTWSEGIKRIKKEADGTAITVMKEGKLVDLVKDFSHLRNTQRTMKRQREYLHNRYREGTAQEAGVKKRRLDEAGPSGQ